MSMARSLKDQFDGAPLPLRPPTPAEMKTLIAFAEYSNKHKIAPAQGELAKAIGRSKPLVQLHFSKLEAKACLVKGVSRFRGYLLTDRGMTFVRKQRRQDSAGIAA